MAQDLLTAFALVLIIEGFLPGVAPAAYQRMLSEVGQMRQRTLRVIGIVAMLAGALMLQSLN
ncbi:MAG: DUF2065 domain-containing protein [Xanthomonadales bacterium]|nr:DUF2065 domain-containing protein [Xanthomonadales bacterium]